MTATGFDNSLFPTSGPVVADMGPPESPQTSPGEEGFAWNPPTSTGAALPKGRTRSIPRQDIAEFTSQLAIMIRSGLDIASALGSLASQCRRPALAHVLHDIHDGVLSGKTFSGALRQHAEVFEANFIATITAGEASGRMAEVLEQLARIQRSEIRSRRTIRAMMTYPILLLAVSSAVLAALVLFVLPRFATIFEQYDVPLPWLTELLIAAADEMWARWWLWTPLAVVGIVGFFVWRKTEQGRRTIDAFYLRAPLFRSVCRFQLVGRTCRLLGLMIQSGVPLVESLRLTREAINNTLYKELIDGLEEAVVNGRSLESALPDDGGIFPESAREMLITAEGTGKIGEVSGLLGEYYDEEAEAGMRHLVGLLEPIIIVGMGALVAAVVLAVMLPVFDLSTLAHR